MTLLTRPLTVACFVVNSYQGMLEWVLGSVAYYVRHNTVVGGKPSCGYLLSRTDLARESSFSKFLAMNECYNPKSCDYLCEVSQGTGTGE